MPACRPDSGFCSSSYSRAVEASRIPVGVARQRIEIDRPRVQEIAAGVDHFQDLAVAKRVLHGRLGVGQLPAALPQPRAGNVHRLLGGEDQHVAGQRVGDHALEVGHGLFAAVGLVAADVDAVRFVTDALDVHLLVAAGVVLVEGQTVGDGRE